MFAPHITHEEVEVLPFVAFGGDITLVDNDNVDINAVAGYLMQQPVLGYDTESQPSFVRGVHHGVSLLQLSTNDRAFLLRVDKIGIPKPLIPVLQNPKILKIGAAIGEDIRGMQRVQRFRPQGFIDLQKMVESYGIQDKAVKKMAAIVLQVRISKSQQTSNWGAKKYTREQMLYAATDAWVCREIYMKLIHKS
ncbi:MAG: 3'-5' exonuclease domain-containing protein 2 [Prevotellaceae bacterium]|jgi:ribonuclease D|nr:3'-5' exonuclease domain-containing protein 2 [Prevotellaceae bacterium]